MKPNEAAQIMLMFRAAYPNADGFIDERSADARTRLYSRKLLAMNFATATEAVEVCIDECKNFPAWSEFRARYNDAARGRPELAKTSERALPKPGDTIASAEEVRAAVAKVVEGLAVPDSPSGSVAAGNFRPAPTAPLSEDEVAHVARKATKP